MKKEYNFKAGVRGKYMIKYPVQLSSSMQVVDARGYVLCSLWDRTKTVKEMDEVGRLIVKALNEVHVVCNGNKALAVSSEGALERGQDKAVEAARVPSQVILPIEQRQHVEHGHGNTLKSK